MMMKELLSNCILHHPDTPQLPHPPTPKISPRPQTTSTHSTHPHRRREPYPIIYHLMNYLMHDSSGRRNIFLSIYISLTLFDHLQSHTYEDPEKIRKSFIPTFLRSYFPTFLTSFLPSFFFLPFSFLLHLSVSFSLPPPPPPPLLLPIKLQRMSEKSGTKSVTHVIITYLRTYIGTYKPINI